MQRGVYFLIKSGPSKKNQEKMWWDAVEGWNGRLNAGQGSDAATRASFNYWPLGPLILFSILLKKKKRILYLLAENMEAGQRHENRGKNI